MQVDKKKLSAIVERVAQLQASKKTYDEEIKELCEEAKEKLGVQAKVVKQLAKETNWNEIERMAQRQLEEELDSCRNALGLLADLPLGEHAQERVKKKREKELAH
jgi:uncharacterized protein (UPF0335 family)